MKRLLKSAAAYLLGVREEFGKVVFPGRRELVSHTIMVIVSIAVGAVIIGAIDFSLAQLVKLVFVR